MQFLTDLMVKVNLTFIDYFAWSVYQNTETM